MPPVPFQVFQATIASMTEIMPGLWDYTFRLDKPITFTAGQYVSVITPGNPKPSPFSIASSPAQHDFLQLGIETRGTVTTALAHMHPGDVVTIKGPFGGFVMGPEQKVCFLAGGVGITPFICMLRAIRDLQLPKQACLFYSCRVKEQVLWREELEQLGQLPHVKVVLTLTRDESPDWPHRRGRIDEKMIREVLPDFAEYTFYSCGPVPLIDAMFALLGGMGIPPERLKREPWH